MARAAHFTDELFRFLRDLERNNDRAWFKQHRDRYIECARDPLLHFIEDIAPKLGRISRSFLADPSPVGGSMFRQHRDTRFSKDKRPYKTHVSAQFRHVRGRDVHAPGFYLHLGVGEVFIGMGIWHPPADTLGMIRTRMAEDPKAWQRLTRRKAFQDGTLQLAGESLRRAPRGYDTDHPLIEDLKRKDLIATTAFRESDAMRADFLDRVVAGFRAGAPLVEYITNAVGLPY